MKVGKEQSQSPLEQKGEGGSQPQAISYLYRRAARVSAVRPGGRIWGHSVSTGLNPGRPPGDLHPAWGTHSGNTHGTWPGLAYFC